MKFCRFYFVLIYLVSCRPLTSWADDSPSFPYTTALLQKDDLGVVREQCQKVEKSLGQLFYVNVDGFEQTNPAPAISPAYVQMVRELNIGGVLPKFDPQNRSLESIQKAIASLQTATTEPLLIGVDQDSVTLNDPTNSKKIYGSFGLGFGTGALGYIDGISIQCKEREAFIEAILHRATGLNQALGPTVEKKGSKFLGQSAAEVSKYSRPYIEKLRQLGIAVTMKHFPYTPDIFLQQMYNPESLFISKETNLHKASPDTKIPKAKVLEMLKIFKVTSSQADFAMTTHLYNSNIDSDEIATFSSKWMSLLRNESGFNGIIMSDGLFMIKNYDTKKKAILDKWPKQEKKPITDMHSIFAARAILAGHDMVFLEGNAAQTRQVFKDLHYIACQSTPNGEALRKRIFESFARIQKYKDSNRAVLRPLAKVPEKLVVDAVKLRNAIDEEEGMSCMTKKRCDQNKQPLCTDHEAFNDLVKQAREAGLYISPGQQDHSAPPVGAVK